MKTKLLSLLILFSIVVTKSYATHVAGGELYYCSLGGGNYLVTYVYYRNCGSLINPNPAPPNSTVTVKATSLILAYNLQFTLPMLPAPNGIEVSQVCGYPYTPPTTCNSSFPLYQGFSKWVYRDTINLPAASTDWVLSCDLNARAENITTVSNPGSESLYVEATLDNVNAPSNCSPVFSNVPMFYACVGHLNTWNYSATDADGDSLVYSLTPARKTVSNVAVPVTYLPPFSATNPLSSSAPGFSLDSNTGMISFIPTANGEASVVCLRIDEYRNNMLIGSVIRDHMLVNTIQYNFNLITGIMFIDINSNNVQDSGEPVVSNTRVTEINTGNFSFSQSNGVYYLHVTDTGNFTASAASMNYYSAVPSTHNAYFPGFLEIDSLNDFAFQPTTIFNDLCVTITGLGPFRTGQNARYMINYSNVGTTTLNNCSIIFFPDTHVTYATSNAIPFSVTSDSVVWNIGTLNPFQTGSITVTLNVHTGTPINTLTDSEVRIEPIAGDTNPGCNTSFWRQYTLGSSDPNDIIVDEDTLWTSQFPNPPYLEYIIRFQNTGNDTAFNVKVLNPVDTNTLQINTLEFVSSSHPVNMQWLTHDRKMEFKFDNILLPDSIINEPASHAFVRYKIKPKSNLVAGESIVNNAAIYFDFNSLVNTNDAITNIVLVTSTDNNQYPVFNIQLYPNPSGNELVVRSSEFGGNIEIGVYNILGEKRLTLNPSPKGEGLRVDVSSLPTGIYFVKVKTDRGISVAKFVKE